MTRQIWNKMEDIPRGSKVLGMMVRTPEIICIDGEDTREVFYGGDEGVVSNTRMVFVEITQEERDRCKTPEDNNKLAESLAGEVSLQMGMKHWRMN
jgi:hypothetical protein